MTSILRSDHWVGTISQDEEKKSPAQEDIQEALQRLDGHAFTSVFILYDERNEMIISGGNDGRYVVNIQIDTDREFYNLRSVALPTDHELPVCSGGQMGSYLTHYIVDLKTALSAALHYTQSGQPDARLIWEHTC